MWNLVLCDLLEKFWNPLRFYNFNHTLVLAILPVLFRMTSLNHDEFAASLLHGIINDM
jgi:hypothetical protein